MTSAQLDWLAYGAGILLLVAGAATVIALIMCRPDEDTIALPPIPLVPDEEPSGAHAITASTKPRSQASCYVDTGQISTAELAILLADGSEKP